MHKREKYAFDFFISKGWNPAQASGIVGNLVGESGRQLNPDLIHDNGTGIGIAGWRDPEPGKGRKTALTRYAAGMGKPVNDFDAQLSFLDHELRTSERAAGDKLRQANTPEAAAIAMLDFERPGGWKAGDPSGSNGFQNRQADARRVYSVFAGGADAPRFANEGTPIAGPNKVSVDEPGPAPSVEQVIGAAARENTSLGWLADQDWSNPDDPDFRLDKEKMKVLTEGIPQEQWGAFEDARSDSQAQFIRSQMQAQMERQRTLSEAGWGGTAASVAATLGDPVGLGVGLATGGVGNAIVWGNRLRKVAGIAALEGIAGAGLQTTVEQAKPVGDWSNVLVAGAGGAFIGAAFGSLSKMPHMAEEAARLHAVSQREIKAIEAEVSGASKVQLPDTSAGAAPGIEHTSIRMDADDYVRLADEENAPSAAFGGARFDATASAKKSMNPATRMMGNALGEDAVGHVNKAKETVWTASEEQARLYRTMDTRLATSHESAFNAWAKERDLGWKAKLDAREGFNVDVSRAISTVDPTTTFDANVLKAARAAKDFYRDYHAILSDPGAAEGLSGRLRPVAGFGPGAAPVENYVTRLFNYGKVTAAYERHGLPALGEAVATAMRRLNPELAPALASKLGRGYVKKLRELAYGANIRTSGAMFGDDLEGLRGLLHDLPGVDPEDVENVMAKVTRPDDAASVSRAKHRTLLDENLRLEMPDGSVTTFADLFLERDIQKLTTAYNRQMSGAVALARMRVEKLVDGEAHLLVDGITHQGEWDTYLQKVRAVAAEVGQDKAALEADIRTLDYLYKGTAGIPLHDPNTKAATVARLVRDFGFLRVMGQVGFAQAAELGGIISQAGFKAALTAMPGLRVLTRNARTGTLNSELAAEMEAIWGFGAERLRGAGEWRITGEAEWGTPAGTSPGLARTEQLLGIGKRVTAEISGLNAINTFMHRWSTSAILHKFSLMADGDIAMNMNRLRSLDLSEEMSQRVFGQFKAHRELVEGSASKLKRINLDKWDDLQAAAAFERAVDRLGRRVVQENSHGMMAAWMSNDVARIILQFRFFVVGAHSKQMLHNIHMWDRESVSTFLATSLSASLGHIAQTVANAPSLTEKQLEDRLSVQGIAKGAFQRTGMSALTPMLIDTAARMSGQEPVFASRSTGQSASIFGNPTTGLVDDIPNAVNAIVAPFAQGRQMSKQEVKAILRPVIWQNALPVTTMFGLMARDLPDYAPRPAPGR
ncbi:MAG: hypothetical protein K0S56_264 [Microvirga sp.]|jgi:hypothetical protein|nr:hypothetical protein [Microvirga sp.]